MSALADAQSPRRITVVLFDRFELLDVFGPLELFGILPDRFEIGLGTSFKAPQCFRKAADTKLTCPHADAAPSTESLRMNVRYHGAPVLC